jgi:F-type H+-transporting ATPase subunit delta
MANGSIARRYARALVALGQEASKVEGLGSDLTTFSGVLDLGEGQLRAALTNPGLTIVERKAVLEQVLAKMSLDTDTVNFLRLLVDKNRFDIFDGIQRSYSEMADDIAGRARATVTTATKLTAAMQKTVQKALEESTGKTVEIDFTVDSGLIGGMVAQVGDISYDASVRTRLDNLQFALTRNPGAAAEA